MVSDRIYVMRCIRTADIGGRLTMAPFALALAGLMVLGYDHTLLGVTLLVLAVMAIKDGGSSR
jgi:hypothetical protein